MPKGSKTYPAAFTLMASLTQVYVSLSTAASRNARGTIAGPCVPLRLRGTVDGRRHHGVAEDGADAALPAGGTQTQLSRVTCSSSSLLHRQQHHPPPTPRGVSLGQLWFGTRGADPQTLRCTGAGAARRLPCLCGRTAGTTSSSCPRRDSPGCSLTGPGQTPGRLRWS